MFGRNTNSYKYWQKEWKRYEKMPELLDYANLGSTCDANNYDYSYWDGNGFNFASTPQDMFYDNQILDQYGCRLRKGAYLFISISEFSFLTDHYEADYYNHKYYGVLDAHRVSGYTKYKEIMLRNYPAIVDCRYIKQELKQYLRLFNKNTGNSDMSLKEWSSIFLKSWKKEFGWEENIELTDDQKDTISRSWDIFLQDLSYCNNHGLIPVVVIPPFCRYLKDIMPNNILEECLWKYIDRIHEMGIKVIDYWNNSEIEDEEYFRTPICLNETGIRKFNISLQQEIRESEKSMECEVNRLNCINKLTLSNGLMIPNVAFGTGVIKRFYRNKALYYKDVIKALIRSVKHRKMVRFWKNDLIIKGTLKSAVESGFRLYDTGRLYGHSEKYIGEVLSNYSRKDFFIVTKVSDTDLTRYPDKSTVHDNLSQSLSFLKTDYVDAYLLHFPSGDWCSMYKAIEEEYKLGRTRSIGVCNFDSEELKKIIKEAEIKPMICQIELHPLNIKRELVEICKENDIIIMAHTPTGHMSKEIVDSEVFKSLIIKYKKSAAQIIYKWHVQNGIIPIMTSTSPEHLKENLDIFDFEISESDMRRIDSLDKGYSFDINNNKVNDCPQFIYNL